MSQSTPALRSASMAAAFAGSTAMPNVGAMCTAECGPQLRHYGLEARLRCSFQPDHIGRNHAGYCEMAAW